MSLRAPLLSLGAALLLAAGCTASGEGAERGPTAREPEPPPVTEPDSEATTEPEPAEQEDPGPPRLVEVVSGLDGPVYVTAASGDPERLYVVERVGRIRVLEGRRLRPRPFLDISEEVSLGGEQGLLSVAFHPRYAENGLFYVNFTNRAGDTRVVEYRAGRAEPVRVRDLLQVDQPYGNHNGGQLQFGPDGLLYVGMGDGGSGGDPENRAQDLGSQLGKLLTLDVDRPEARWQTAAYGLRNPWRFSFDRETGDLWIGDVGQGAWEEIDFLAARSTALVNFGWDVREGTHAFEAKEPNPAGRLVDPVAEYSHELGCSVTGGYVYRGAEVPALAGRYLYGDFCSGTLWTLELRGGEATKPRRLRFTVPSLSSFGEDARGELYAASLEGVLYRIASAR